MSYPGNTALAQETKDRLLRTFTQTLDLAARGGVQEALLGCDFILRLDPLFQPARELHERLSRATGSVDVDDLRAALGDGPTAPPPATYGTVQMPAVRPAAPAAPARPTVDLAAVRDAMRRAYDSRDFEGVIALATQQHALLVEDSDLRHLAEDAQAHVEAEPYIRRFLDGARNAINEGQRSEVDRLLQKAATLDPTHPEIAELQQLAADSAPASAAMPEEMPLSLADLPQDFELSDTSNELSFANLDSTPAVGDLSAQVGHSPGLAMDSMPSLDFDELPAAPAAAKMSESDARIQELLDEGDGSLQRGEYQAAIDAWSRIFLIDIDHAEAAKRIEQARKLKAEAERQTEELFHEGVARFEAADTQGARERFERVLSQQPGHLAAREMLEQIEAGKVRSVPQASPASGARPAPTSASSPAVLKEEILVPPEPGSAPAKPAKKPAAAAPPMAGVKRSGRGKLFIVGGIVLALAAGGGWYLMTHRDRLFPNSQPPAPPAAQQDVIARATALHDQGKTPVAIAQLRRVPAGDPLYEKAQALITQWQAADQQQQPAPSIASAPTATAPSARDTLLESARAAYTGKEFLKAEKFLDQAAALAPLDGAAAEQLADVRRQVAPLQEAIAFCKQGEYEIALRGLWRLHEADRANRDIVQLMVDSYYNLGVKALQREAPAEAVESFKEAVNLDAKDESLQRLAHFADAYLSRAQDLQYKIFVKYLTTRS